MAGSLRVPSQRGTKALRPRSCRAPHEILRQNKNQPRNNGRNAQSQTKPSSKVKHDVILHHETPSIQEMIEMDVQNGSFISPSSKLHGDAHDPNNDGVGSEHDAQISRISQMAKNG